MSDDENLHVWCPECQWVSLESTFPHTGTTCAACNARKKGFDLTLCKQCPSCREVKPFRFFQHYVPERMRGDNPNRVGVGYTASAWHEGTKCAVCAGKTKERRARRIPKMNVAQLERAAQTGAIDPALLRVGTKRGEGNEDGPGALIQSAMGRAAKRKDDVRTGYADKKWAAPWNIAASVVRKELTALSSKEQYQRLHPHDTHDKALAAFIDVYRGILRSLCKMLVARGKLDAEAHDRREGELHLRRYNLEQRREDYRRDVGDSGMGPADGGKHAFKAALASAIMTPHSEWDEHVRPAQLDLLREEWALLSTELVSQRYKVPPMLLNRDRRSCMDDKSRAPAAWELKADEEASRIRMDKATAFAKIDRNILAGRQVLGVAPATRTPIDWAAEFPGTQ